MNKYVVIIISKLGFRSFDKSFDISTVEGVGKFMGYCQSKVEQDCDVTIQRFENLNPMLDSDLFHSDELDTKFKA